LQDESAGEEPLDEGHDWQDQDHERVQRGRQGQGSQGPQGRLRRGREVHVHLLGPRGVARSGEDRCGCRRQVQLLLRRHEASPSRLVQRGQEQAHGAHRMVRSRSQDIKHKFLVWQHVVITCYADNILQLKCHKLTYLQHSMKQGQNESGLLQIWGNCKYVNVKGTINRLKIDNGKY